MDVATIKSIYDNFEVFNFSETNTKKVLTNKIGGTTPGTDKPLIEILSLAVNHLKCKSCIIEREYVDADYLDEFCCFYAKSFKNIPSKTIRLHFFKEALSFSDICNLSEKEYMGFAIVRPIKSFLTGRTIILPPDRDVNKHYILCGGKYEANLAGNSLKIVGAVPFMQQDTNVCICAEASLWIVNNCMSKKFRFALYRPSTITKLATSYMTGGSVRAGINFFQVIGAMKQMGYNVIRFPNTNVRDMKNIIYSYIESEIPVMLSLKLANGMGHAITVIGHDYDPSLEISSLINSSVDLIRNFYYHDDAEGSYRKLNLHYPNGGYSLEENVIDAIVPLPEEVTLQADDVFCHAEQLLKPETLNGLLASCAKFDKTKFEEKDFANMVTRIYLRRSNEFKTSLPEDMHCELRLRYRAMHMPKYVWVVEISRKDLVSKSSAIERRMIGEILIDSTADRHDASASYISIHLLGRVLLRSRKEERPYDYVPEVFFIESETPYLHLVRRV